MSRRGKDEQRVIERREDDGITVEFYESTPTPEQLAAAERFFTWLAAVVSESLDKPSAPTPRV